MGYLPLSEGLHGRKKLWSHKNLVQMSPVTRELSELGPFVTHDPFAQPPPHPREMGVIRQAAV